MKKLLAILLTLATFLGFMVGTLWLINEYQEAGQIKAVGDEWTRLSTTTVDAPELIIFAKGPHVLTKQYLENKEIHLEEGARVFLSDYTLIGNSKIRVDTDAHFIVRSNWVTIMGNLITGSSTDPVMVTFFNDEPQKPILSFNRFEHFNQRRIGDFEWRGNIVDSWGFVGDKL